MVKGLTRRVGPLLLLLCSQWPHAFALDLLLVGEREAAPHQEVANSLLEILDAEGNALEHQVVWLDELEAARAEGTLPEAPLLVTIGYDSALALRAQPSQAILHTLISPEQFDELYPSGAPARVGALFFTQPLERQLNLISLLLPERREVLALLGPRSGKQLPALLQGANQRGIQLETVELVDEAELEGLLREHLKPRQVLFTPADPSVVNRRTIQTLLLTAFRSGAPVVGYSNAMVKAGALMAVHTTPEMIGEDAAEIIRRWFAQAGTTPLPRRSSKRFEVAANYQVDELLDMGLPKREVLRERLQQLETEHQP